MAETRFAGPASMVYGGYYIIMANNQANDVCWHILSKKTVDSTIGNTYYLRRSQGRDFNKESASC
ncbi:hypothetical protein Q4520_11085 [Alteromonas sp. 1_MG-2023]|uniref:hypothetical protein n=1 Tax=unclassified Alteromonas TaxID=2614992 RepID=UPI0026E3CD9D|nr:hypothetical protein [Alteromonas sp. 1_MG-2023]MDO6475973.1 hypothetical protein [Alteromonas sp. 1_MG-2023]